MSQAPPLSLLRVPTLTEIVSLAELPPDLGPALRPAAPAATPATPAATPADLDAAACDPARLREAVLREVEQRIGMVVEQRLRDALAPALASAADTLVAQSRDALESTLREVVAQAVAAALERHAGQPADGPPR